MIEALDPTTSHFDIADKEVTAERLIHTMRLENEFSLMAARRGGVGWWISCGIESKFPSSLWAFTAGNFGALQWWADGNTSYIPQHGQRDDENFDHYFNREGYDFPSPYHGRVPIEVVFQAVAEFTTTQRKPTCIEWIYEFQRPEWPPDYRIAHSSCERRVDSWGPAEPITGKMMLPECHNPLLIRTDFSDQGAWEQLWSVITTPSRELFSAGVHRVDDVNHDEVTAEQIAHELCPPAKPFHFGRVFALADSTTFASSEKPVLLTYPAKDKLRQVRVLPDQLWVINNNFFCQDTGWDNFLSYVDEDGVFRSFSHLAC